MNEPPETSDPETCARFLRELPVPARPSSAALATSDTTFGVDRVIVRNDQPGQLSIAANESECSFVQSGTAPAIEREPKRIALLPGRDREQRHA
jgi:hypothetical protein